MNTVIASKTPTEFELVLTDEYRAEQRIRNRDFMADFEAPFEGFTKPGTLENVKYDDLNTLLVAVWEVRQKGWEVSSCDDPMARRIGFILGDEQYAFVPLTVMAETKDDIAPETLALFGLTLEEFKRSFGKTSFRHWLAIGGDPLPETWAANDMCLEMSADSKATLGNPNVSDEDAQALVNIWIAESEKDKPVYVGEFFPDTLLKTVEVPGGLSVQDLMDSRDI